MANFKPMKLFLRFLILVSFTNLYSQDISGIWSWEYNEGKHMTELVLSSNDDGKTYTGYYCSAFYNGKTMDCNSSETEICINISRFSSNTFSGTFSSPSYDGTGEIELNYNPESKELFVSILNDRGLHYFPNKVTFN